MRSLLVHVTSGSERPTQAALALLVAATAANEGIQVNVFVAGDGVLLLRQAKLDIIRGIGTGEIKEHLAVLKTSGTGLWASRMSAASRGISTDDLQALGFTGAPPAKLVELVFASERVLVY